MADGAVAEMATVGREGVTSIGALWGTDVTFGRLLVEVAGSASTLDLSRLRAAANESEALRSLLAVYTQAFPGQVMQGQACRTLHSAQERCDRWLLMAHDRSAGDRFPLTHEFLAQMVGVNRSTVSLILRRLQQAGLIRSQRGAITVLDRAGLEAMSCECYGIIRRHFEDLLPHTYR